MDYYIKPWAKYFCKNHASLHREKIINKANAKFKKELDIIQILEKVRDSHDIFRNILDSNLKNVL